MGNYLKISAIFVVTFAAIYAVLRILTVWFPPAPTYDGPAMYVTAPASQELLILQAGPSAEREIELPPEVLSIVPATTGKLLALYAGGGVRTIDVKTGVVSVSALRVPYASGLVVHPDGHTLLAWGHTPSGTPGPSNFIKRFNLDTLQPLGGVIQLSYVPTAAALGSDGKTLYVCAFYDGMVLAIDWESGTIKKEISLSLPEKVVASPTGIAIYVLRNHSVSVIDPANYSVSAEFPVSAFTHDITINSSGTRLLVTSGQTHGVSAYNAINGKLEGALRTGLNPQSVVTNESGTDAFVLNGSSNDIAIVDPDNANLVDLVPLGKEYRSLILDQDGKRAYLFSRDSKILVTRLSWLSSGRVLARIPTGKYPGSVAVHLATQKAYVSNVYAESISVVDIKNRALLDTLSIDRHPGHILISADGTTLYGGGYGLDQRAKVVWKLDLSTKQLVTVSLDGAPSGLALNSNETVLFATLPDSDKVSLISTATNAVIGEIPTKAYPLDAVVVPTPGGERLFVAERDGHTVEIFNASIPYQLNASFNFLSSRAPLELLASPNQESVYVLATDKSIYKIAVSNNMLSSVADAMDDAVSMAISPDGTRIYRTSSYVPMTQTSLHSFYSPPLASGVTGTTAIEVK